MKSSVYLKERLKSLRQLLAGLDVDACVISHPLDVYYLTGMKVSAGMLAISKKQALLFVDGRYIEAGQRFSSIPVKLAGKETLQKFLTQCSASSLAFDSSVTSYDRFIELSQLKVALKPASSLLKTIRAIKDKEEIKKMHKSAELLWEGFKHIKKTLKKGVSEKEVAFQFEVFSKTHGAEALAFDPIIAFGANSAMPHYRAGESRLKKGDVVLIDIGVVVDGYHSDMTRSLFFGKGDPLLYRYLDITKESQRAALKLCRPGTRVGDLDEAARKVMRREGVESLFSHSLGHGIGIETHEFPRISKSGTDKELLLQEGMVITIEPGLYLPGKGGVRYEDTVRITAKGHKNFYPEVLS